MNTVAENDAWPRCTNMAEIRSLDGKQVSLIGAYRSAALHQGPKRMGVEALQAVIRLDDGTKVLLEPNWSPASRRGQSERDQFDNHRVAVEGTIHVECPEPPEPLAYITGPCVSPVLNISLLPEESAA